MPILNINYMEQFLRSYLRVYIVHVYAPFTGPSVQIRWDNRWSLSAEIIGSMILAGTLSRGCNAIVEVGFPITRMSQAKRKYERKHLHCRLCSSSSLALGNLLLEKLPAAWLPSGGGLAIRAGWAWASLSQLPAHLPDLIILIDMVTGRQIGPNRTGTLKLLRKG